ncbi:HAD-superfamily subfamily IB hydrolase, TIGR01490 [Oceanospirillum multiglobuliferum]|uniref:Histidinol-phosphatase n=1 Tax=Oceanospirillum multiglobuliferum TaxID=64969 RepID=A0A1T4SGZ4_9GAMM|nr:HAD family hydrolase [Oceanospirillum multiglobuliferum]OPX54275.1 phosphoserine phosphatase [Oceanospirillum multiglobuliferum]SKA27208.1 HAD-superfamily subfamily IB hydrolase, TIGR01490 [Oceanospirillum multiglobuliferum]
MSLAIFDLDNTLIAGDSDHAWGEFLVEHGIVDAHIYKTANDRFYQNYLDGSLDIMEYLSFSLRPLAEHSPEQLQKWHQQFMLEKIQPIMLDQANEKLAWHKAQGDFILIITATNRFVTEPIAEHLGVHELIAIEPEMVDGRYTGQVAGIPSFKEGKVIRLRKWLEDKDFDLAETYFYSDSHNDLPLLRLVGKPIAVDPDETLKAEAEQNSWPVISFR